MLVIRAIQMQAFQQRRDLDLARAVVAHLQRHDAPLVAGWPDALLERRALFAYERAQAYGITDLISVAEFFVAMIVHAPDFDVHPEIHALLQDEAVAPDHRIHAVWSLTTKETWAAVQCRPGRVKWPDERNP